MKFVWLWLLVFGVFIGISHQQAYDNSFRDFCQKVGGALIKEEIPETDVATDGDTCKNVDFGATAENKDDAKDMCKNFAPFYVKDVEWNTNDHTFVCEYKTLHICRVGFTQIRGKCYRIGNGKKPIEKQKAAKECEAMEAKVYVHYNEEIGDFIDSFFPGLTAIWTNIPEDNLFEITHNSGPNLAVVYKTSQIYKARYGSLVKIPDSHLAMVMCEYVPHETTMSLKAILEIWKPYIHTSVIEGTFTAWRTYNHYMPELYIHDTTFGKHQVDCKASMKAIMDPKDVKLFDPTVDAMNLLKNKLKNFIVFLAPFGYCKNKWCSVAMKWPATVEQMGQCTKRPPERNMYHDRYQDPSKPCPNCQDNENSKNWAVLMPYDGDGSFKFDFTHPRQAPRLCDVILKKTRLVPQPCEADWITYNRTDGTRACHLFVSLTKQRDEARDFCFSKYGAHLGGWREAKELEMLQQKGITGWVSLKRHVDCPKAEDGEEKENDKCHYNNILNDPDDVSDNSLEGRKLHRAGLCRGQPENTGQFEYCMVFKNGCMHDWNCEVSEHNKFTCTKLAELKEE